MDFPLQYIERNLIYNQQREAWAAFRLEPWHYDHLSVDERLSRLGRLSRLFWNFEEHEGQLLVIPRSHGVGEHLQNLSRNLPPGPLHEVGRQYCQGANDYLERLLGGDSMDVEHYLLLRVDGARESLDLESFLSTLWQEPRRFLEELAGLRSPEPLPHEVEQHRQKEELVFQRLNQITRAERCHEAEVAWLIRRAFFRGMAEPGPVAGGPRRRGQLVQLAEGEMDLRHPRRVALTQPGDSGDQTAYQAFVVLSELPAEMTFPGAEWVFSLQDLPFPVEVCLRWSSQNHRAALAEVRRKKLEISDQDRHTRNAGENIPLSLLDAQDQGVLLEHDLQHRKFPILHTTVFFCVTASDQRVLWERVKQVRDHLSAQQVSTELPAGDQFACFVDALPGSPRTLTEYRHRLPPEVLAGSMFLATRALGDRSGPYVGRTGILQKPVYLDPALAPRLDRSGSMAFIGSPGGGKSFAANLLTYLAVIHSGARAVILDPKGERSSWLERLPELQGHLNVVTLGPDPQDTGKLDPFVIGRSLGEAGRREMGNLAISLLSFLTGARPGDTRFLVIVQAVEAVVASPMPSLTAVVERLTDMGQHRREAAEVASYLKAVASLAYANLLFGRGDEDSIDVDQAVNILQLQNIIMPSPSKVPADYTLEEHLSVTLMHAVTAFAMQFTRRDRDVFKIVLLDEAWSILGSSQGKAMVGQLLRTGRAMNNAIYLVTQNCSDLLDETIKNNLGVKFIFRSRDRDEIGKVLEFLDLEPGEENDLIVRSLESGTALMQDLDGRVGVVRIDPVYEHLLRAFNTRPDRPAVQQGGGQR